MILGWTYRKEKQGNLESLILNMTSDQWIAQHAETDLVNFSIWKTPKGRFAIVRHNAQGWSPYGVSFPNLEEAQGRCVDLDHEENPGRIQ
jgi:hypothetical protein